MISIRTAPFIALALTIAALAACSDTTEGAGDSPDTGFLVDDIIPQGEPEPEPDAALPIEDADPDEPDVIDTPDVEVEDEETGVDPACDQDGDGALSVACGGQDCDDTSNLVTPGREERCDAIDNNCNGVNNEGVDCTFFAHTGEGLYRLDPFMLTSVRVTDVPNLFDIDTHPDGTLYGIAQDTLYRFEDARNTWFIVGTFPELEDGTGLAIDSMGTAWVTAADKIFTINLTTAQARLIGPLGGTFFSSGDCVINKEDTLFMTSKDFNQPDTLVLVNRTTGRGTAIGNIGFSGVFGLTAGYGRLFGVNSRGELLEINRDTGQGTLLHTFPDKRWFGAASSPGR